MEPDIITNYVTTGKVKIVHRMLGYGGESGIAAEAAECAGAQGRFLEFSRKLYENVVHSSPAPFSRENLMGLAAIGGLDADELGACLESHEYAPRVQEEREAADALGIEYTPTIFINGEKIVGLMSYEVYQKAIEKALAEGE